jgi:hypothetical protein
VEQLTGPVVSCPDHRSIAATLPCHRRTSLLGEPPHGTVPSTFFECGALTIYSRPCRFAEAAANQPSPSFERRNAVRRR